MAFFILYLVLALYLSLFPGEVVGSLQSTGQTLLLNDLPYYVPATPVAAISTLKSLKKLPSDNALVPVTVVDLSASNSSLSTLEAIIASFGVDDDVWNEGFLEGKLSFMKM